MHLKYLAPLVFGAAVIAAASACGDLTPTPTSTPIPTATPTEAPATPSPTPTATPAAAAVPTLTQSPPPTPTSEAPAAKKEIGDTVEPIGAQHIPSGERFTGYNTVPPSSGPHWDRPAACGVYDQEVPDERVVHNMEHGNVIISYNLADAAEIQRLEALLKDLPAFEMWGIARPYFEVEQGTVAMTAWGVVDSFEGVDEARIIEFYRAYARNRRSEETARFGPIPCGKLEVPAMTVDAATKYTATINTNQGTIVLDLFPKEAPKTVNNFVSLARDGFYDGTIFHRVMSNFMIQGGDPTGTGRGGPGYNFEDEFHPSLVFDSEGILAMANSGPGTNGSQFFITVAPTPWLTGAHTIFGRVREGQDVVVGITAVPKDAGDKPLSDVIVESIVIQETSP